MHASFMRYALICMADTNNLSNSSTAFVSPRNQVLAIASPWQKGALILLCVYTTMHFHHFLAVCCWTRETAAERS